MSDAEIARQLNRKVQGVLALELGHGAGWQAIEQDIEDVADPRDRALLRIRLAELKASQAKVRIDAAGKICKYYLRRLAVENRDGKAVAAPKKTKKEILDSIRLALEGDPAWPQIARQLAGGAKEEAIHGG